MKKVSTPIRNCKKTPKKFCSFSAGGGTKSSVLVLDFEDRSALDDYLKNEPYAVEHVWEKIEVETINVVIMNGEKVGG